MTKKTKQPKTPKAAKQSKKQSEAAAPATSMPAPQPSGELPQFGGVYYETSDELVHVADAMQIMTLLMSESVVQFDKVAWGEDYTTGFMLGVRLIAGALHRIEHDQVILGLGA